MKTVSRAHVRNRYADAHGNADFLRVALANAVVPDVVKRWLGRLKLLDGIPINYLVADERMLPPESIRFFHLDNNWIDAVIDGAFSIGRNLTRDPESPSMNLDRAQFPRMDGLAEGAGVAIRQLALGRDPLPVSFETITGFLLRSSLVAAYPGLGVNAYDVHDGSKPPLEIVRMERLGQTGDTLICLVAGDAVRFDIHEAPEALHYGVDRIEPAGGAVEKGIYRFTTAGDGRVTILPLSTTPPVNPVPVNLRDRGCLRTGPRADRTLKMARLAEVIAEVQVTDPASRNGSPPAPVDAAQMGFEMTEGVGMVSFRTPNQA